MQCGVYLYNDGLGAWDIWEMDAGCALIRIYHECLQQGSWFDGCKNKYNQIKAFMNTGGKGRGEW